jgi:hypothetical protein
MVKDRGNLVKGFDLHSCFGRVQIYGETYSIMKFWARKTSVRYL